MTTENTNTENDTVEAPEVSVSAPPQKLQPEQEIHTLRAAHQFFSNFDRVPGYAANQWSQALDAIALVANSLIAKHTETLPATAESESVSDVAADVTE